MGLTFSSKGSQIELTVGYASYFWLKEKIANLIDKELGEHYSKGISYEAKFIWKEKEWQSFYIKAEELIEKNNLDIEIVDFLFYSDLNGKISYRTCKKIYDLIKNEDMNIGRINGNDLKQLLLDCYSHRANLIWE